MSYDEFPLGPGLSINEMTDANMECKHGRCPFDPDAPCGCFPGLEKGGPVVVLPQAPPRRKRGQAA